MMVCALTEIVRCVCVCVVAVHMSLFPCTDIFCFNTIPVRTWLVLYK